MSNFLQRAGITPITTSAIATDNRDERSVDADSSRKTNDYDLEINKVADAETDHYAHLGVDLQPTVTEEALERKLIRKIDLHIMPLLMITTGIQVRLSTCKESPVY